MRDCIKRRECGTVLSGVNTGLYEATTLQSLHNLYNFADGSCNARKEEFADLSSFQLETWRCPDFGYSLKFKATTAPYLGTSQQRIVELSTCKPVLLQYIGVWNAALPRNRSLAFVFVT
jgi:hypothetical protein